MNVWKKRLKGLAMLALTLLSGLAVSLSVSAAGNLTTVKVSGTLDYDMANEVLQSVNQNRENENLEALTMNAYLQEAAMQRAMELAVFYSHTRPDGEMCFSAISPDYASTHSGENIAIGYHTAEEVMEGWMNSPGHRANILDEDFTQIGVGCYYRGRGNYWDGNYCWVQMFGNGSGDVVVKTDCVFEKRSVSVLTDNLQLKLYWTEQNVMPYPLKEHSLNEGAAFQANVFTNNQWTNMMLDSDSFQWSADSPALSVGPDGTVTAQSAGAANVIAALPDGFGQASVLLTVTHVEGAPATCTTPQKCKVCGEILADALGHKAGAAATCTIPQRCTVCGEVLVAALGHKGGDAPTCTKPQTCTVCGVVVQEALGHKAGAAATCTTPQKCSVCGVVVQEALGHSYTKKVVAPTETKQGYTLHVCSRCEDSYKDHYVPAKGSSSKGDSSNKDNSGKKEGQKTEAQKKLKKPSLRSAKRKSGTKAVVKWKKVSGAGGYELQMSTRSKKGFQRIAKLSAKKTSYTKKKLSKKKTYYFRVRAYKKVNGRYYYSAWSKVKKLSGNSKS